MDKSLQRLGQPRDLDSVEGGAVATNLKGSLAGESTRDGKLRRDVKHAAEVVGVVAGLEGQGRDDTGSVSGAVVSDDKTNIALKKYS